MGDDRVLDTLAAAICDGTPVDWNATASGAREAAARERIRHLRVAAEVARAGHASRTKSPACPRAGGALYWLIVAAAGIKVASAVPGYVLRLGGHDPATLWPHLAILLAFALAGSSLCVGGLRDLRSRNLGALFVMVASAFANRGLVGFAGQGLLTSLADVLRGLTTEGFLAYALWAFVTAFPRLPERKRDLSISRAFLATSAALGVVLLAANLCVKLVALGLPLRGTLAVLSFIDRSSPHDTAFWPVQFALAVPALPYLLWRSRFEASEDRRRVGLFAVSLAAGLLPILAVVMVAPFVPFFDDPLNRRWFDVVLYASLVSVVPATAYAVLVHRVLDVALIVRKTLQHRLARYGVRMVGALPVIGLVVHAYMHRDLSMADLASQSKSLALVSLVAVGVAVGTRRHVLRAIDRRFLRDTPDYPRVLANLERRMRSVTDVKQAAEVLAGEFDRAVHPASVAVLLPDERGSCLAAVDRALPPLSAETAIFRMLASARQEIQVGGDDTPLLPLLPDGDRTWVIDHRIHLLVPLVGSCERLVGAVAFGEKRSETAFSRDDRLLLSAMAGQAAVTIENLRLRSAVADARAAGRRSESPDGRDEAAAVCSTCGTISPSSTRVCRCGSATHAAALPLLVEGKFQLERVLGSGGMGVVYLAVDISLGRRVAIKTLPRLAADRARRLRIEARAMARVQHPNLATIYGVEEWRERPLLVVEYLEGGTLADRLQRERLAPADAMALGVVLADVLDRVHGARLLHRDIKPSNIAYTAEGVAKILDFGLATIFADEDAAFADPAGSAGVPAALETTMTGDWGRQMGTLAYLSPNAIAGEPPDCSFDLWSVAVVLYECIAGVHPLAADNAGKTVDRIRRAAVPDIRTFRPDCPQVVAAFLSDSLAFQADRRPRAARDLRERCESLRAILASQPV